ncbi:MAG TPA: methyltransferase domain-containing protein [Chloroflexota bacterium]|nr:methyltransferase domain-containing protein [Chloroflexota bacterium]
MIDLHASTQSETARVRAIMDRLAPNYDRLMSFNERLLFAGGREWVCWQARGDVLEIAIGTGRNLPYYPANVKLTGLDVSPAMLQLAAARAATLGVGVDLQLGDAEELPFPYGSYDTVVCTLSLCTIPDDRKAVQEVRRILRPGGLFLLLEHVRSPLRPVRLVQRALDSHFVRVEGDHLLREPLELLKAAGFEILALERRKLGLVERVVARKPS